MRRREFMCGLGAVMGADSTMADTALPRFGYISTGSVEQMNRRLVSLKAGLQRSGLVDGRDYEAIGRSTGGSAAHKYTIVTELLASGARLIVTGNLATSVFIKSEFSRVPIVFVAAADPVAAGLVKSVSRPEGMATGITTLNLDLSGKRVELLKRLIPRLTELTLLSRLNSSRGQVRENMTSSAARLGMAVREVIVESEAAIVDAFRSTSTSGAGMIIGSDGFFTDRTGALAQLSLEYRVPSIFQYREFALAGGLVSYGIDIDEAYRLAGDYIAKILGGVQPDALPVRALDKVRLVINKKTASMLALNLPDDLLSVADEVIE